MNQHIQKQIEELRDKFSFLNSGERYLINPEDDRDSVKAFSELEAFLKTSLERVWEEAEKEMLNKLIKHYEHNGWLTNDLNDIRSGKKILKQTT